MLWLLLSLFSLVVYANAAPSDSQLQCHASKHHAFGYLVPRTGSPTGGGLHRDQVIALQEGKLLLVDEKKRSNATRFFLFECNVPASAYAPPLTAQGEKPVPGSEVYAGQIGTEDRSLCLTLKSSALSVEKCAETDGADLLSQWMHMILKSPKALLKTSLYTPVAQLYHDVIGKQGALVIWSLAIVIQFNSAAAEAVDTSRVIYAFARDGALPFSRQLSSMNKRTNTPVYAVWFTALGAAIIGLMGIQDTAYTTLSSTSIIALYISYMIPIFLRITSGRDKFRPGPFRLGPLAYPIGTIACLYVALITLVFLFPAAPAPNVSNMNWSVLVLGAILGGSPSRPASGSRGLSVRLTRANMWLRSSLPLKEKPSTRRARSS